MDDLERREAMKEALYRLWTHAARYISIQHPDPNVFVEVSVEQSDITGTSYVRLDMRNLRDTVDRDLIVSHFSEPHPFHMELLATWWPGYEMARVAIAGAWIIYMQHECCELVTNLAGHRVVDPHCEGGLGQHRQTELGSIMGHLGDGKTAVMISLERIIGGQRARVELNRTSERAQMELDTEIGEVLRPTPRWE